MIVLSGFFEYDIIIVGGGAAGLSAAIYSARYGMKTAIIEEKVTGGLSSTSPLIENYPGFKAISGMDLMDKMREHAETAGAKIIEITKIVDITIEKKYRIKCTSENEEQYYCKACILAMGTKHRKLNVLGEEKLAGRGVSYCSTCDGPFFKNKKVAVVGGSNNACLSARYLNENLEAVVNLVHRRRELRGEEFLKEAVKSNPNIKKYWDSVIQEIKGQDSVQSIVIRNVKTNELQEIPVDGVFINIGEIPQNELAKKLGLKLDDEGYILVNRRQETSKDGIYAAGDITGGFLQISVGVGEGATAAVNAFLYIQGGWYSESKI